MGSQYGVDHFDQETCEDGSDDGGWSTCVVYKYIFKFIISLDCRYLPAVGDSMEGP